ncbi:MAG: hypothetical protein Q7S51_03745 [Gallionellaceae bacterium]|nr:hypothetical protein [Gallionellaceae bacterium]
MFNAKKVIFLITLITLAGCSDSDKKMLSVTSCSVDAVNDSGDLIVPIKVNSNLKLAGWAADSLSKQAPDTITINLVSSTGAVSKFVEGKLTVARPDVSKALDAPKLASVGFGFSAQLESLASGIYEIQILQNFPDRVLFCKSAKSVRID